MKTKQLLFLGLLGLSGLISNGQTTTNTFNLTSGGFQSGTAGTGVYYGTHAGKEVVSGHSNTFIGTYAGSQVVSGSGNTFIGTSSGNIMSLGNYNTFIGAAAGYNSIGNNNTILGNGAGSENETGSNNTILGTGAGANTYNYSGNVLIGYNAGFSEEESNKLYIENTNSSTPLIWGDFAQDQLKFNGKVGVGYGFGNYPTTAGSINVSNYNLFVKGGLLTEEVRVSLTGTWADYVFKKDYKLPTLQEVEKQIQEKGHLFNVPSAQQVKEDGIELGEMAKIQQEKIEELTLYIIEQNKTNEKQSQILDKQSQEIEELKALVKTLVEKK